MGKGGFGKRRVAKGERILEEEETRRDDAGGRGGRPGTLPLPWVGGSCDGGDVGVETLSTFATRNDLVDSVERQLRRSNDPDLNVANAYLNVAQTRFVEAERRGLAVYGERRILKR